MAELRQDPVSGRWVIIATERAARPHDFYVSRGEPKGGFCPFCEGNEGRTPPEITAIREAGTAPDGPGWQVRVVANKFPALRPGTDRNSRDDGLYRAVGGHGAHEVIIETPRHLTSPTQYGPEHLELVLRTYAERSEALSADELVSYVLIFKNVGAGAGASIEHSHSQLIAVPVMPKRVAEEMRNCAEFYRQNSRCLLCHIVEQELRQGERVVAETEDFLAVTPYASRFPFEMWVLPRKHMSHFHRLDARHIPPLAGLLHQALSRLETRLKDPPFNLAIHTAPVGGEDGQHYHWHIEIIPRVTHVAGFEWGTGFYINPMEPETAARYLREVSAEAIRGKIRPVDTAGFEQLHGPPGKE